VRPGFVLCLAWLVCGAAVAEPQVKVVPLDPGAKSYQPLLKGPPQTKSFHSGLVILKPGEAVGVHTTGKYEEMLVPLQGEGELRIAGRAPIPIKAGLITYTPPHTVHNVVNTGNVPLRYIYITAKAE
jgi:mannose-6-phosphate isomerase-like protein (cupin superfamily)